MTQPISAIGVAARLEEFLGHRMARHLKDVRKRGSFALYAQGMLGDGERKSMEPIAARACAEPEQVNNLHSKLGYFIGRSVWDDQAVRLEAARYAIEAVEQFESESTLSSISLKNGLRIPSSEPKLESPRRSPSRPNLSLLWI